MRPIRTLVAAVATLLVAFVGMPKASAITNGEPDFVHTYTGAIAAVVPGIPAPIPWCSGTLVAPTVFVTAAHCLGDEPDVQILGVTFDQDLSDGISGLTAIAAKIPHPDYPGRQSHDTFTDIGVVLLAAPVTDVGFAELPTLGQFDSLKPGPRSSFTKVGYGMQLVQGSQFLAIPARYVATAQLVTAPPSSGFRPATTASDSVVWVLTGAKGTGGGTCFGDSGGSVLWQDTDVLAAVHSSGLSQCVGLGFEVRLDTPFAQEFLRLFVL